MKKKLKIVLAGNPNSGKTTIFNQITGSRQHVGNYPGVTVEKKTGFFRENGFEINVTDLPGTYSLSASSPEEKIARDVIINEKPDLVLNVVDASNLERNLYLTLQLMELEVPVVLILNMVDDARRRGVEFDLPRLEKLLGIRIIETVGHRGTGIKELKRIIADTAITDSLPSMARVQYGETLDSAITRLRRFIDAQNLAYENYSSKYLALKLLEKDSEISGIFIKAGVAGKAVLDEVKKEQDEIEKQEGEPSEIAIAERRYGFIAGACMESVRSTVEWRREISDCIDVVLTNRILGIPIFLGLMYLVFKLTFAVGDPFMGWIDSFFIWLENYVGFLWGPAGDESLIRTLIVDGIIAGVGGVLVFMPNILLLFLAIAVLEGTGYMARAAFIMDKLMHKIGLHGRSFIPMLIGFGCTVPAIMATRTLESQRDRLTTMLVAPLMSCGARLPIYALIIPVFFPEKWRAGIMWTIYLTGIVLAVICARLLRSTLFKGKNEAFVMELPPYRIPTVKNVLLHMWERAALYLKKAGTLILAASVILWVMTSFPEKKVFSRDYDSAMEKVKNSTSDEDTNNLKILELENEKHAEALTYTIAGRIGHFIEPALRPLGFDWKIGTALIGAFAAKEIFVSQLGIVYSVGDADEDSAGLREKLRKHYTPLQGFCVMLFCLISAPCMATIAVTRRESNSWKWALFQLGALTLLAYVVTLVVYQAGTLLGIGQ